MYLHFFAPKRSFCLVNVIRLMFVTAFLKNFLVFVVFVYLYKKLHAICELQQITWSFILSPTDLTALV